MPKLGLTVVSFFCLISNFSSKDFFLLETASVNIMSVQSYTK